jgi:glycosyltransferase 2 family protein
VLGALSHQGEMLVGKVGEVSLIPLAVALTLHLAKLGVRARAWHNIVCAAYPSDRPRFRHALGAFLAGTGVGACVPARAGQLVRLSLMRSRVGSSSFPGLVSTLIAESVFDAALTALIVVAVLIAAGPGAVGGRSFPGPLGQHPVIAGLVAVAVTLAACRLAVQRRARIRSLLRDARIGLAVFTQPVRYLRGVASWQALGCTLRVASTYWFLVAFHVPASLHAALLVIAVQLVVGVVPLTPGGAGPQQAILVAALSPATTSSVLGFGIGSQVTTLLADLLLGGVSLILMTGSLRWRRIARADQSWSPEDPSQGARPSHTSACRALRPSLNEEGHDIQTQNERRAVAGLARAPEIALLQTSTPGAGYTEEASADLSE